MLACVSCSWIGLGRLLVQSGEPVNQQSKSQIKSGKQKLHFINCYFHLHFPAAGPPAPQRRGGGGSVGLLIRPWTHDGAARFGLHGQLELRSGDFCQPAPVKSDLRTDGQMTQTQTKVKITFLLNLLPLPSSDRLCPSGSASLITRGSEACRGNEGRLILLHPLALTEKRLLLS